MLEEPEEQAEVLTDLVEICESDISSIQLLAVVPEEANGTWVQTSGPSSIDINDPNAASTIVSGLEVGTYTFEWSLSFGECGTFSESTMTVIIEDIPDGVEAEAGNGFDHCGTATVNLGASMPNVGTGSWSSSTSQIVDVNDPNTEVNLVEGVNVFTWTLSNGVCTDYSNDEVVINFTATPDEEANIITDDLVLCETDPSLVLNATAINEATGEWTQLSGPNLSVIDQTNSVQTAVSGLVPGSYVFTWTLSTGTCEDFSMDQITIQVDELPSEEAVVLNTEIFVCNNSNVTIEALAVSQSEGMWTSPTGATILNPTNSNTEVANLEMGENTFVWTLSNGACENFSQDLMTIFVEPVIEAVNDEFTVSAGQTLTAADFINNDLFNDNNDWTVDLISTPNSGVLTFNNDGTFDYQALDGFEGTVSFVYEICNESCGSCTEAIVSIMVLREEILECHVPNILTPNDDQANDFLVIPCVTQNPDNQICIFNRWGNQVYQQEGYENDWNGQFEGADLPAGTYFYVLRVNDDEAMTGYITLIR